MPYISSEILEQIRDATDIVDLISEYVVLKQRGRNFVGLCPFHSEKTPSFSVNPEKQIFYCFGCGAGGDVFTFLMQHEHMEFPEAVQFLAEKTGIRLEQNREPGEQAKTEQLNRLYQLNLLAARFFYRALTAKQGKNAAAYLVTRGITPEIRKKFALGYAFEAWDSLLKYLETQGFNPKEIVQAGLAIAKEGGTGYYDRFRNRVMFPIQDQRGRFIAFGGRVIDGGEPKYLNSPETAIFQKKYTLYGLKLALPEIRRTGKALIMEGYMDVISAHQHGHTNAVASLGTAFTREQARLLSRYAQEIIIAYDSDNAGIQAALRCISIFDGLDVRLKVLEIPEGKDPDEYLKNKGGKAFGELIYQAPTAFEYKLNLSLKQHDATTVQGKVEIVKGLLPDLAKLKSSIERQEYIKLIARKLNISEEAIYQELKQEYKLQKNGTAEDKKVNFRHNIEGSSRRVKESICRPEHDLLKLVLEQPELVLLIEKEIGFAGFTDIRVTRIFETIKQLLLASSQAPDVVKILEALVAEEEKQLLLALSSSDPLPVNDRIIEDSIKAIKLMKLKQLESEKRLQISQAEKEGNLDRVRELTLLLIDLQKRIQSLK